MKKTNKKMMILSFFGIIFVVIGHLTGSLTISKLFPYYSFHMVLFIFISGYFYKEEYANNLYKKDGYFINRFKKFVIPYYFWNFIYGLFVTILIYCGIKSYGNVKTVISMLYGMCVEDLNDEDFKVTDEQYPLLISVMLQKK